MSPYDRVLATYEKDVDRLLDARRGIRDRFGILIGSLGIVGSILGVFLTSAQAPTFSGVWLIGVRAGVVILGLALGVCLRGLYTDERHRSVAPMSGGIDRRSLYLRLALLRYVQDRRYNMYLRYLRLAIFLIALGTFLVSLSLWYTLV